MSATVSFMNIREAIRHSDEKFFSAIESAVTNWVRETDAQEIQAALFSPQQKGSSEELKVAA